MSGEFRKHAAEAFRQMEQGAPAHPALEEISAYLRGRLSDDRRAATRDHLAKCAQCGGTAAELELFISDIGTDSERAGAGPREDLDKEYRELQRRLPARAVIAMPRRWMAIAAGAIALVGLAAAYRLMTPSTPKLLAEAYRERRSFEFRIAGADYSELRQQRAGSSAFSLPPSLLKAQSQIKDELQLRADDAGILRLEGEAESIGGDASAAVQTLRRASDLRPNDAQILADLGIAFAMLGGAEHDFGAYSQAIDCIDRSLRLNPHNLEAMFNRAVVLEKLMLYDQAEIEWKAYLKADPSSGWAKEARARLAAIEEKMQKREKGLGQVRDDPRFFLALADSGAVDAEAWLMSKAATQWLARSANDPAAKQAVVKLAGILATKHGDTWLQEMTSGACASVDSVAALSRLMNADDKANRGDYEGALVMERQVAAAFSRRGCVPGAFRARQSQLVAMQNSGRLDECLADARGLSGEVERYSYVRLRARVARSYGVCAMRLGQLDESSSVLKHALQLSRRAAYSATVLDLWNMDLDKTTYSGLPSEVLAGAEEAMRTFWNGSYSRGLLSPSLKQLWRKASRSGQSDAALRFARAEVWAADGPGMPPLWQVGPYGDLAASEQELGELSAARTDLETSNRIATMLPSAYRVAPAVALARFDLEHRNPGAALARLTPLDQAASGMLWVARADYYTALGEALALNGSRDEAVAAFQKVIASGATYLSSLKAEDERSGVRKGMESAYRSLVAAQLAVPGNEATALRTWQTFLNFDAPREVRAAAPAADGVLWVLELPDGYVEWFQRDDRTWFHRFEAPAATVRAVAARFLLECSNPLRGTDALRTDARALYQWMVEPFSAQIGSDLGGDTRSLVVELDGALAGVPIQALMSGDGKYLGERFSVLISAGRASAQRPFPGRSSKVLVVANPAVVGASASRFPPLPASLREAEAIRASFTNSVILEGRDASVDSLAREMPNVDIIHFAGHGYSHSGDGGLLFAPKDPSASDYQLLRAVDMRRIDWSRCSLAVLSACAAAEGETHGAHNPESLIRAIVKAGASRAVASLWNVDSAASSELMELFYASLNAGESPAEALRTAQRSIQRNPRWAHPYYWAGFQLYGAT